MKLGEIISKAKVVKCRDKELPVLSITLRDGFVFQSSHFKKEIASKDKSNYNIVKRNQLVQSIHIDEGGFSVQQIIDEGIVSPAYRVWDVDTSIVNPDYLNTFLRSKPSIAYYKSKLRGTIHRRGKIDDADILGMNIPVPTLVGQEKIVAELDCLTDIIEKKKQQLEELDKLAQSIFYDMFGDPITNEKGWEMKKLGDVATVLDSKRKPITKSDRKAGVYPYYGATGIQDYVEGFIFDGRYLLLGEDGARWGAGDKSAFIIEGKSWVNNHAHVLQIGNGAKDVYIQYHLNICDLLQYITGAIVPKLTQASMVRIPIMLPPLDLQNEFAQKIKAIEKQKELVKRSIVETETLFNSRMDFWFNN